MYHARLPLPIILLVILAGAAIASADYQIDWFTFDGGGAQSLIGGEFSLSGTIGQPDASATLSGGGFELTGGFWAGVGNQVHELPGDLNCDGVVNNFDIDPFVTALTDPAQYEIMYPDCDINNGDVNGDNAVNNFDIDPFVELLTGN